MPPASRFVRLRAPLLACLTLAFAACDGADRLTDPAGTPAELPAGPVSFANANFRGGIPFGMFALPNTEFGDRYNGAHRNNAPNLLVENLAEIRQRGGKVVLMFAGNEQYYKDQAGNFDLAKWQARVDRYKGINFSSYVTDGTVIAHYLIDEPNDPANWNGKPVPPAVLEQMAEYSKRLWPGMPTVVRAEPGYLGSNHKYLDAAWAQYLLRKGTAADYLRRNVADAQERGLGLIIGMNVLKGGENLREMTATQVREWGSVLLGSSYPCAFISWTYDAAYLGRSDIKEAMSVLAAKAEARQAKSCRPAETQISEPISPTPPPSETASPEIQLKVTQWTAEGRNYMRLNWSGANGATVDIHRNGKLRVNTLNDGRHTNNPKSTAGSTYTFKVCEKDSTKCSSTVTAVF